MSSDYSASKILLISAQACRLCGKPQSPRDLLQLSVNTGNGEPWGLCQQCYAWHTEALLLLGRRQPPSGRANCRRSLPEIQAAAMRRLLDRPPSLQFSPADLEQESRKMWLHALDGVYVLLCRECTDLVGQLNRHRKGAAVGSAAAAPAKTGKDDAAAAGPSDVG